MHTEMPQPENSWQRCLTELFDNHVSYTIKLAAVLQIQPSKKFHVQIKTVTAKEVLSVFLPVYQMHSYTKAQNCTIKYNIL